MILTGLNRTKIDEMGFRISQVVASVFAALLFAGPLGAQTPCSALPELSSNLKTIFSPEQEAYLGDAIASMMEHELRVYSQPKLTAPLEAILARLNAELPANSYAFHLSLIEIPEANAFAIAGGRIYVSRRLVGFVESEDELAGVLAHEMGHIVARQASAEMSRIFHEVLKVNAIGDRDDVFRKFHALIDAGRSAGLSERREQSDQLAADHIALQLMWRAGYDPQSFPRFLDRLTEIRGAKGNIWTDLFGMTRPESKRLRELLKSGETLPASCHRPHPTADGDFRAWQRQIVELDREDLKGEPSLQPTLRLTPKLRPQISNIKFSSDGTLLLAQDESGIHVLSRDPFGFLLRIPALDAGPAQFDLSSKRILIPAANGRLEAFDIETRKRELLWEISGNESCTHLLPSPDGRFLACFSGLGAQNVRIVDVSSKQELAHHEWNLSLMALIPALARGPEYRGAKGAFTPDGAAFLLSSGDTVDCCAWAFDLNRRAQLSIGKPLRDILAGDFAFLSPDRIAVMNPKDYKNSGIFLWPGGGWAEKFPIPPYPLDRVTKGATLLLKPFQDYAVASLGVDDRTIYQVSRAPAVDRYDDVAAVERTFGELALYPARRTDPIALARLPDEGELANLRSAALSADLTWLAISTRNRSMAWNLASGKSIGLEPFDGGSIDAEGILTATFERTERVQNGSPGKIFRAGATADLRRGSAHDAGRLPEDSANVRYRFDGDYIVTLTSDPAGRAGEKIEVRTVAGQQPLWTNSVEAGTRCLTGDALILILDPASKAAKRILSENPALKKRFEASSRSTPSILMVLQIDTGKPIGQLVYDGGMLAAARLSGRTLFVEDQNFRTLAYSLDSGERLGQIFGRVLATNSARQFAAIQNRPGSISVLDGSMQTVAEFVLGTNVIFAGFDAAGKRLLTLTGTQDVFIRDLP